MSDPATQQAPDAPEKVAGPGACESNVPDVAARYGLAFALAPIGMVLLTPEGRIIEVNRHT